jgi:hypothetical protein
MSGQPRSVILIDDPDTTNNAILDGVLAYWNRKRGSHAMPSAAEIMFSEIPEYRPWLSFADVVDGYEDFRYTFVGQRVVEYFLFNATGHSVREAFGAARVGRTQIDSVLWLFRKASLSRRPLFVSGNRAEWRGLYFRDYEALYLPLSENGVTTTAVMCAFTYKDFEDA